MTLEQFGAWNRKIPFTEYEALLDKIESKKRALSRACETVYSEEVSLEVLADEKGSALWEKHDKKRRSALARSEKLKREIESLEVALVGNQTVKEG